MFKDLYKTKLIKTEGSLQEQRRTAMLQAQKRQRVLLQDEHRENVNNKTTHENHRRPTKVKHSNMLQLSEWLREFPEELDDWLLLPCPRGQRCLVMAAGGRTKVYNKAGRQFMTCHTLLPGDGVSPRTATTLDCMYVKEEDAFYVLDALEFGQQSLVECEAQFRFFWLRSKFEENLELGVRRPDNEKPLRLLPQHDFENAVSIAEALQRYPLWPNNKPELDGFLFYHKEASYTRGTTPLVCWLFPFMVPDVLGLTVSNAYEGPASYEGDPLQYMETFDATLSQKNRRVPGNAMDTNPAGPSKIDQQQFDSTDSTLDELLNAERTLELEQN